MSTIKQAIPRRSLLALFVLALFAVPMYAQAEEWHIQDNATGGDCSTIGTWDALSKTCTLTQDLNQGIVIGSDEMTLDGAGHTITGAGQLFSSGRGVSFSGLIGVTIKNLNVQKFDDGIFIDDSDNTTLADNDASNNLSVGIHIRVLPPLNLFHRNFNVLTGNTASNNGSTGIAILNGNRDTLTGNTANSNGSRGIALNGLGNHTLTGNTASNNDIGILLSVSSGNTLTDNVVQENTTNDVSVVTGNPDPTLDCNNDFTNTVGSGDRPIEYFHDGAVQIHDKTFSELILCNADGSSINNVIIDGSATKKNNGLILLNTDSSTITNTTSSDNNVGVRLLSSNNNTVYGNTFFSNTTQALVSGSGNSFNLPLPIGGNHWDDYDAPAEGCNDTNGDNFCDAPYVFMGGQDNLPWTIPIASPPDQQNATLTIIKHVVNDDGGNRVVSDFPLFVTKDGVATAVESGIANEVSAGTYTVSETNVAGYTASLSNDCDASGVVTIAPGEHKICTITNDDIAVPDQESTPFVVLLQQYRSDGINPIAEGGTTIGDAVIIKGAVASPIGNQVRLQIELQSSAIPFTDNPTASSDLTLSGNYASVTIENLSDGSYHWQARVVDSAGNASAWHAMKDPPASIDFMIIPTQTLRGRVITFPTPANGGLYCGVTSLSSPLAKKLVIITHGLNDNALESDGWVQSMARSVSLQIESHDHSAVNDWAVCVFDWKSDASHALLARGTLASAVSRGTSFDDTSAGQAFRLGGVGGQKLGNELVHVFSNLQYVHFIGHSAGSNVIQNAATALRIEESLSGIPAANVHLTFLDAYDPTGPTSTYGKEVLPSATASWFADHYVDMHQYNRTIGYNNTNIYLANAYNVDVTAQDPHIGPVGQHAWPRDWYENSTTSPEAFGFQISLASGKIESEAGLSTTYPPGGCRVINSDGTTSDCISQSQYLCQQFGQECPPVRGRHR